MYYTKLAARYGDDFPQLRSVLLRVVTAYRKSQIEASHPA